MQNINISKPSSGSLENLVVLPTPGNPSSSQSLLKQTDSRPLVRAVAAEALTTASTGGDSSHEEVSKTVSDKHVVAKPTETGKGT